MSAAVAEAGGCLPRWRGGARASGGWRRHHPPWRYSTPWMAWRSWRVAAPASSTPWSAVYVAVRRIEARSARSAGSATALSIHSSAGCPAHRSASGPASPVSARSSRPRSPTPRRRWDRPDTMPSPVMNAARCNFGMRPAVRTPRSASTLRPPAVRYRACGPRLRSKPSRRRVRARPPRCSAPSSRMTGRPALASVAAAVSPARPPPTTIVCGACMPSRRSTGVRCDVPAARGRCQVEAAGRSTIATNACGARTQ